MAEKWLVFEKKTNLTKVCQINAPPIFGENGLKLIPKQNLVMNMSQEDHILFNEKISLIE